MNLIMSIRTKKKKIIEPKVGFSFEKIKIG